MIALPTREGWLVNWYTGEVRPKIRKDRKTGEKKVVGELRFKDCFESTSKE